MWVVMVRVYKLFEYLYIIKYKWLLKNKTFIKNIFLNIRLFDF